MQLSLILIVPFFQYSAILPNPQYRQAISLEEMFIRIQGANSMRQIEGLLFALALGAASVSQAGVFAAGRVLDDEHDAGFRITAGVITDIELMVQETTRKLYDVTGDTWKQDTAENYSLNDFDVEDNEPMVGLSFEKAWKFFSLQFSLTGMNPSVDTTARRNYYISVGESVEYMGQSYDHMKIPEGTQFSMDVVGGTLELTGLITFFTLQPMDGLRITPWIDIGLFGFAGEYDIEAGEVQGVTQYQNPPKDFVIGGKSSGTVGAALPQYGGGGEIRIGGPESLNLVLQGHYLVCQYDGSTEWVTTSDHREKNLDLDHVNLRARLFLEIPAGESCSFMLGVQYQSIETEGVIESTATSEAEVLEQRERFDKKAEFRMESLQGVLGFTF